jgi:hypothetical protein
MQIRARERELHTLIKGVRILRIATLMRISAKPIPPLAFCNPPFGLMSRGGPMQSRLPSEILLREARVRLSY